MVRAASALLLRVVNAFETGDTDYSANPSRPKTDRLGSLLSAQASVSHLNVGFSLGEFEELCSRVCPLLEICARFTGEMRRGAAGRPPKLSSPDDAIFYLKYQDARSSTLRISFYVLKFKLKPENLLMI